jgi:N-acetylmuramoyl-L-alanine amidase
MRQITDIVIHCTATKEGKFFNAKDIDQMHKAKGWSGIGYHYVILLDGTVEKGRPDSKIGAHVKGYNSKSIGVVYVGGLDKNGRAKDTRTDLQKECLKELLKRLKWLYTTARISGHRDFSPDLNKNGIIESNERMKECPCFDAKKEYIDV